MAHLRRFLATFIVACLPLVALPHHAAIALSDSGSTVAPATAVRHHVRVHSLPSRRRAPKPGTGASAKNGAMVFHGGAVMTAPLKVYVIWYGEWSHRAGRQAIIRDFVSNLASPYYSINSTYPDRDGNRPANSVTLAGEYTDHYSVGRKRITDDQIDGIVGAALKAGRFPSDPEAVYLVITSKDVDKPGFLTQYCGWHSFDTIGSVPIKFAFIGDPSGPNLKACAPQTSSPNKDAAADAMASVIAHEIDETVSDPQLDGWYAASGEENGDRCAWQYGTTYAAGKARANLHLGRRDFYIQTNWLNTAKGGCVLAGPDAPAA